MPGLRRSVRISVAALGLGFFAIIAGAWWYAGTVRSEIADQDQVIEQRNAVLAASLRRAKASTATEEALRALRDSSRPRAVDVIDALSAALPDSAYLTTLAVQKDQIQISGVTQNTPELVPALENSGRFKDVGVTAAIDQDGDRNRRPVPPSVASRCSRRSRKAMNTNIQIERPLAASIVLAGLLVLAGFLVAAALADLSAALAERDVKADFVMQSLRASQIRSGEPPAEEAAANLAIVADSETLAAAELDTLLRSRFAELGQRRHVQPDRSEA